MFRDAQSFMDEKNVKACDLVNDDITAQYLSKLLNVLVLNIMSEPSELFNSSR